MSKVVLGAPLRGWAAPLDEVPDPVFAERMTGDGIAVDPLEGLLLAPAAATVAAAPATAHAVTLRLANGAHVLIHIGVDTVALRGEGFTLCVSEGQEVAAGDPLIRFDLDAVARRAKSLITPVVLIDEGYSLTLEATGRLVEPGEPLMTIEGAAPSAAHAQAAGPKVERCIAVPLANGLHARPAARVVNLAKSFSARIDLAAHGRKADARSMVALMALGLKQGDEILLSATGADAEQAAAALAALIEGGMGEGEAPAASPAPAPASTNEEDAIAGVAAAPGLAVGPVAQFRPAAIEFPLEGRGAAVEESALAEAIGAAGVALRESWGADGELGAAHLALLEDPELLASARTAIAAGRSAGHAWRTATAAAATALRATGDPLLIERIADLEDVERQVAARLAPADAGAVPAIPPGAILVADELLPSQFLAIRPAAAGIVTARGGPTSHVAILAASAGLPMLVAAGPRVLALEDGARAVLDADAGRLDPAPNAEALAAAGRRLAERSVRRASDAARAREDCRMADGTRIEIFANLSSADEAEKAVAAGAEGCGLLRTEFLFLDRADPPSEDEQAQAYGAVAAALGGRPLIVRTLDVGGDKDLPYLPLPREENPALGRRGIRLSLARPDLLAAQLRAILRGVPAAQCRIMLPMVVERDELRAVRAVLDEAMAAVGRQDQVQLGVMIETPAAALLAASLAEEADFLSVGTNDLTQYALACDRGNPATAARIDALHPAVLHLIDRAAEGARRHGRWFGICGGVASDPAAAAILTGLGATELSAVPAAIPALKAVVRGLHLRDCEALARQALQCASAAEVRRLVSASNEERGAA